MHFILQTTEIHPDFEIKSKKNCRTAIWRLKFELIEVPLYVLLLDKYSSTWKKQWV